MYPTGLRGVYGHRRARERIILENRKRCRFVFRQQLVCSTCSGRVVDCRAMIVTLLSLYTREPTHGSLSYSVTQLLGYTQFILRVSTLRLRLLSRRRRPLLVSSDPPASASRTLRPGTRPGSRPGATARNRPRCARGECPTPLRSDESGTTFFFWNIYFFRFLKDMGYWYCTTL